MLKRDKIQTSEDQSTGKFIKEPLGRKYIASASSQNFNG